jgi:hypothetical protein
MLPVVVILPMVLPVVLPVMLPVMVLVVLGLPVVLLVQCSTDAIGSAVTLHSSTGLHHVG